MTMVILSDTYFQEKASAICSMEDSQGFPYRRGIYTGSRGWQHKGIYKILLARALYTSNPGSGSTYLFSYHWRCGANPIVAVKRTDHRSLLHYL